MYNILFAGNDGVFDGILTCTLSVLKRSTVTQPFRFIVFTMDVSHLNPAYVPITDAKIAFLNGVVQAYNPKNTVEKIDVTDLYMQEFSGCPNETAYCSPYTLIRLLADLVTPKMPDKLLYLDADIMFQQDISSLYDRDLEDSEYAAAPDHYGKYLIHPRYINAGVLLFNMKRARETGLFQKAREWLRRKKLVFADQSALIRSTTKKKLLQQRFNDQKFLHKWTVVRHFSKRLFWFPYPHTENIKQWHIDRMHHTFRYHQFDDILEEYINLKKQFEAQSKEQLQ